MTDIAKTVTELVRKFPERERIGAFAAAIPHWIDAEMLLYLLQGNREEAEDILGYLAQRAIVRKGNSHTYTFHEAVRHQLLEIMWKDEYETFLRMSQRAADYFDIQHKKVGEPYLQIEYIYHLLISQPEYAVKEALSIGHYWCEMYQSQLVENLIHCGREHFRANRLAPNHQDWIAELQNAMQQVGKDLTSELEVDFVVEQTYMIQQYSSPQNRLITPGVGHVAVFAQKCFLQEDLQVTQIEDEFALSDHAPFNTVQSLDSQEKIRNRILQIAGKKYSWNGRTVRLLGAKYTSHGLELTIQPARYFDYLSTNYAAFIERHVQGFPNLTGGLSDGSTIRNMLEPSPYLNSLTDTQCANQVGISCILSSRDNRIVLHKRANIVTFPGTINPLPSSIWSWNDLAEGQDPFTLMWKKLMNEETFISKEEALGPLICIGITRELSRAGKPEMFFYLCADLPYSDIKRRIESSASEQPQIRDVMGIELPDDGNVDRTKAILDYWIFDNRDSAPTVQGALSLFLNAIFRGDLSFISGRWIPNA